MDKSDFRSDEEALAQLTAFVAEEELFVLMKAAVILNLNLGLKWADDLIAERREDRSVQQCLGRLHQLTSRLVRYGRIIEFQRFLCRQRVLVFQLLLGVFWMFLIPLHLVAGILRIAVQRRFDSGVASLFAAGRAVRAETLSSHLAASFLALEVVKVAANPVLRLRLNRATDQEITQDDVGSILGFSETLYQRLDYLELVDDDSIVDLLTIIVGWQNVYSLKALSLVRLRLTRFPAERERILPVLRDVYLDKKASCAVRGRARRALLTAGEPVSWLDDLWNRMRKRYWQYLKVAIVTLLGLGIAFIVIGDQLSNNGVLRLGLLGAIAWFVYRDANKIGVVRVERCNRWDALGPEHYAAAAFLLGIIAVPAYFLIRETARAAAAGIEIEFIRKRNVRKEDLVKQAVAKRGEHPGLICVLSAMEPCSTYKPWHDKASGKTFLRPDDGKCLHYYFYFIDEELGLCYVRVPTWLPCRLQIYFNGHPWLAAKLRRHNIAYKLMDNAFVEIADWNRSQQLANGLEVKRLHGKLDQFARTYCPIHRAFGVQYHWRLDQCEYATDVVFKRQADLAVIYDTLTRTAIHTVKPDNIATFLGKKLNPRFEGESGNRYNIRIEGTRIKHTMGPVSLKLYDKFSLILRIETTVNDLTLFKHYREVEHRDGTKEPSGRPCKRPSTACLPCASCWRPPIADSWSSCPPGGSAPWAGQAR